jgi:predicted signal transduction protein with EAL and GGDEF domain
MDEALSADYITVNDDTIGVSVARGVAIFDPLIDHVYTDVFAKADHAMYMHKMSTKGIPVS